MKGFGQLITGTSLAAATALALTSCQGKKAVEIRPIAASFQVNKTRAPIGSPIEITYRFQVAPDCKPVEKDYWVFVHFLDSHDEMLPFTDDHQPPQPVSSWAPGSTVEYTRTLFLPLYPYLGTVNVELGLYVPATGERLGLGAETDNLAYRVGQITLLDQKENIFLVYKEGWHQLESQPEDPSIEWQWTKKEAVCSFKNPKTDCVVYLDADTNVEAFETPLKVSLVVGANEVAQFEVGGRDRFLKKIPVPASALGAQDWVDLRIVNDKSFIPQEMGQGADIRELGLRIYHLYVAPEPGT